MNPVRLLPVAAAAALVAVLAGACATSDSHPLPMKLPSAAALTPRTNFVDPLIRFDGSRVTTSAEWTDFRRSELKTLFQHYMYGSIPPKPSAPVFRVDGVHRDFLGGKATLKLVTVLASRDPAATRIDLMLVVPNDRRGSVPVFLAMNFCGNHALTTDPRVPLARGWIYDNCKGSVNQRATEACRGIQSADWDLAQIIDRGYAIAAFCSSDVDSDRANVSDGVYAWLAREAGQPAPEPANRGSVAAWAWGYHRCVDYLVTDTDLDGTRIAAVGHSRNGKTALLAAAFDERIGIAFPHQAGCGGTAPSRGKVGESVKQINDRFPHWFNGEFKDFNLEPERLPFDQHCLVALMAPRPVLFSNAVEDQWANPAGQFEVLRAADPVYRFLGVDGLGATSMPPTNQLVASRLGYFIRPGKHSMIPQDWRAFLDFADAQWRRP